MIYFGANFLAFPSVNLDKWVNAVVQPRRQWNGHQMVPNVPSTLPRFYFTVSHYLSISLNDSDRQREGWSLKFCPDFMAEIKHKRIQRRQFGVAHALKNTIFLSKGNTQLKR